MTTYQVAIQKLIDHLDGRKEKSLIEMFDSIATHFATVFAELVPGQS